MRKSKIYIIVPFVVLGLAIFFGRSVFGKKTPVEPISGEEVAKIEITADFYDVGQILMKGGIVEREYGIKNGTGKSLVLRKIVTSCMCTRAQVKVDGKSTPTYGMEMSGDRNPRLNFEIPPGATAKLIARFDPAAHGLQGVGKFERSIWLTFADPVGVREFRLSGEVVLQ